MCYINTGDNMQINVNNQIIEIKLCKSFKDRLFGLMFKKNITPLCFPKCRSIHTFFMKQNIDIIMCDKNNIVIGVYKNTPKNKIIINKKAYYTYELPINKYDIKLTDKIS